VRVARELVLLMSAQHVTIMEKNIPSFHL